MNDSARRTLFTLLGLCPLLSASTNLRSGVALGCATLAVALVSGCAALPLRRRIADWLRWPTGALLVAIAAGCVELGARAFAYESYRAAEPFLPLLASNCLLLAGVDGCSTQPSVRSAMRDTALGALAMALLLIGAGALRELLPGDALGAAGLLAAGLLIAAKKRWWDGAPAQPRKERDPRPAGPRRVRVTGPVR